METAGDDAVFCPAPWLRNRHAQTILATCCHGRERLPTTVLHVVHLEDGDRIVLHDDSPAEWLAGSQTVLLVHGLAGCHASPYMRRIAAKLVRRGVRTFRLDLRGSGAGALLAKRSYHAGLTSDLAAAARRVAELCPGSPIGLAGFSLGGNLLLKWLGDANDDPENPELGSNLLGTAQPPRIFRAVAVCPPIDLAACSRLLARPMGRIYERHLVGLVWRNLLRRRRTLPDMPLGKLDRRPRCLRELDDLYTAPVGGFRDVDDYYQRCGARLVLGRIGIPTTILAAEDDPVVDATTFDAALPPHVRLRLVPHGGHLGFLGHRRGDPDWHWMDWRCVQWLTLAGT